MMTRYEKGAKFERALVHDFWERDWAAMRSAGSGNTSLPAPDLIAAKDGKIILVECKSTGREKLHLKGAILALHEFSRVSGGRAYIAVKFLRKEPRFYEIGGLMERKRFTISISDDYLSLDAVIGMQGTFR
ncbi:MAG: hypothetical protein KKE96_04775 [Candidatus Altiarchaeota archaeon]|nr:hypothetical protein [Candidatus Altiarchaeota archaeon]MBU4406958.1 hypothetical protein [Candidatus Altiarchaeota archaeon]